MRTTKELLELAGKSFEKGEGVGHDFLLANNITSDECYTLMKNIEIAIKNYARLDSTEAGIAMLRAIIDEESARDIAVHNFKLTKLSEKIHNELRSDSEKSNTPM